MVAPHRCRSEGWTRSELPGPRASTTPDSATNLRQIIRPFTAWDGAADTAGAGGAGGRRRAVLRVLHRQAAALTGPATGATGGVGEEPDDAAGDRVVLHVCRTSRLPDPTDPD